MLVPTRLADWEEHQFRIFVCLELVLLKAITNSILVFIKHNLTQKQPMVTIRRSF